MKSFLYLSFSVPALAAILSPAPLDSSITPRALSPTSTDGNCGSNSATNATCLLSTFGNCCSEKGFCGKLDIYCGEGCQSGFGTCTSIAIPGAQVKSTSGACGATASANITCLGSTFGDCCSPTNFCGSTEAYCGTGCQSTFGKCPSSIKDTAPTSTTSKASAPSTSSTAAPTVIGAVSVDGNCGSNSATKAICLGSEFGDCCSELGYCGGNSSYCAAGCQSTFGSCSVTSSSLSTTKPTTTASPITGLVSVDGNCAANSNTRATCLGSSFGDCCSSLGFCGANSSYCGTGCQSGFGSCFGANTNSSSTNSTGTDTPVQFLGTGAKAGISVAAVAAGLGIIGFIIWYVLRRRRDPRRGAVEKGVDADPQFQDKEGLVGAGLGVDAVRETRGERRRGSLLAAEIGDGKTRSMHEMAVLMQPVEMSSETAWSRKEEEERRRAAAPVEMGWNGQEVRAELASPVTEAERRMWVDKRVAAGYDGAYRGN